MNKLLVIIVLMIFLSIFFHFYNKHIIFQNARENMELAEMVESKKDMNQILRMENIDLSSLARIEHLAMTKLDMVYPKEENDRHTILFNQTKQTFSLLDFFVPSVEALQRN